MRDEGPCLPGASPTSDRRPPTRRPTALSLPCSLFGYINRVKPVGEAEIRAVGKCPDAGTLGQGRGAGGSERCSRGPCWLSPACECKALVRREAGRTVTSSGKGTCQEPSSVTPGQPARPTEHGRLPGRPPAAAKARPSVGDHVPLAQAGEPSAVHVQVTRVLPRPREAAVERPHLLRPPHGPHTNPETRTRCLLGPLLFGSSATVRVSVFDPQPREAETSDTVAADALGS